MAINLGPMLIEKKKLTAEWLNETCGDTAHTVVPHGHYWALVNVDHGCELQVHRDGDRFYVVFRDRTYKYFDCPRFIEFEDDIVELCRILGFSCGESENSDNCREVNYGT